MGFFDTLAFLARYPQSVMTGLSYGQKEDLVDAEGNSLGTFNPIAEGFKGNLSPSKLRSLTYGEGQAPGGKLLDTALDVGFDPTLGVPAGALSKAAKGVPGVGKTKTVQELARGASTFGKIADPTVAARVGKGARLLKSGSLGAYDQFGAASVLGAASLLGLGENQLAKLLPRLASRTLQNSGLDSQDIQKAFGELGAGPNVRTGAPAVQGLIAEAQEKGFNPALLDDTTFLSKAAADAARRANTASADDAFSKAFSSAQPGALLQNQVDDGLRRALLDSLPKALPPGPPLPRGGEGFETLLANMNRGRPSVPLALNPAPTPIPLGTSPQGALLDSPEFQDLLARISQKPLRDRSTNKFVKSSKIKR